MLPSAASAVVGAASVAALALGALAGCSAGGHDDPTQITVATFAGLDDGAQAALDGLVAEFEDMNPDVRVTFRVYGYDAQTFATDAAAGAVPTVFVAPFTDAPALVADDQVAHVEDVLAAFPYLDGAGTDDLDVALTTPGTTPGTTGRATAGTTAGGTVRGVPATASPARLVYDRDAFRDAGLDPDDPPTTWAQVRRDAKLLAASTGGAGLGVPTENGSGGATLAAVAAATGGRIEHDGAVTFAGARTAAELLHDMRWQDGSLGTTLLGSTDDVVRAFAAGKVAMVVGTTDLSSAAVRAGTDPDDLGIAPIPLTGDDAGVAVDGMTAFVSPDATSAQQDAAARWIDTAYVAGLINGTDSSLSDVSGTVASRALAAAEATDGPGGAGGIPTAAPSPAVTGTTPSAGASASGTPSGGSSGEVAPSPGSTFVPNPQQPDPVGPLVGLTPVNVAAVRSVPGRPLVAPPVVAPRAEYVALDAVVRAVLTDRDADVPALLAAAQRDAERTAATG
ncbi:ABC-type glycerol-3-phosphate transport system substrate-binding protein [Luteimicrobium subarcticum]|uniref:ABC-type glycerol-3-phosphate transport system substrate-binding protein n=1 Tax=Luteimicrobium subarcticum TaxID=620910 RepID=A0A2M8W1U1_9MICO|nr:ABC-type glycerol-3-phosphate transport system substrate-binding protein [Luteimicrobium subarcticum]